MAAVDLSTLSPQQLRDLFASIDNVYSDNDGVLSVIGQLLPGVSKFVQNLQAAGKNFKIITNNTVYGRIILSQLFKMQGLELNPDDIITPIQSIIKYLKDTNFKGKLWVNAFETMVQDLEDSGFKISHAEDPKHVNVMGLKEYLFSNDPDIKAIIFDTTINTTTGCIIKLIEYLKRNPEILLIFGGTDSLMPVSKDSTFIGPLYFQNFIAECSKREPLVFGKPSDNLGRYLLETLNCDPSRTLFIGDVLESDIRFAKNVGFKQLLVLTGVTKEEEIRTCDKEYRPDYYVSSLAELNALLNKYSIL